jgi:serine/threonine protein kinase
MPWPDPNFNLKNLTVGSILGKGAASTVYRAQLQDSSTPLLALKLINNKTDYQKELKIIQQLDGSHENLIGFIGASIYIHETKIKYAIVMQLASNGSLDTFLNTNPNLTWDKKTNICRQVASGLQYLHEYLIIHRDIKTQNILMDDSTIKITDFNLSAQLDRKSRTFRDKHIVGTPFYISPKMWGHVFNKLNEYFYTEYDDIYAFGVLIAAIAVNQADPQYNTTAAEKAPTAFGRKVANDANFRPNLPEDTPTYFRALFEECTQRSEPPTAEHVVIALTNKAYLAPTPTTPKITTTSDTPIATVATTPSLTASKYTTTPASSASIANALESRSTQLPESPTPPNSQKSKTPSPQPTKEPTSWKFIIAACLICPPFGLIMALVAFLEEKTAMPVAKNPEEQAKEDAHAIAYRLRA